MTGPATRILLADDDPVVQLVVRAALESGGYSVITAENGREAVERVETDAPDCVILDVMMPEMDGYEACRRIRSMSGGKDLPILVLTSLDDVAAVSQAYESGATDFAAKGLSNRLLYERVRFLLRANDARLELQQSRSRLQAVQDMAKVGHWEIAPDGKTVDVAPIVRNILGMETGTLDDIDSLRGSLNPQTTERLDECLQAWRMQGAPFELDGRCNSGAYLYIRGATATNKRPDGGPSLTLALQDVTAVREARKLASQLAQFHALTGLPNKRRFIRKMADELEARSPAAGLAMLVVHVRGHERLAHSVGIAADDQALVEISRVLRTLVGEGSDVVNSLSYLEAGNFAIMVPIDESPSAATAMAQKVISALAAPIAGPGWLLAVEPHIGISVWPQDGSSAEELLANAQATAARVVDNSTERFGYFTPEIQVRAQHRLRLESDLHTALERNELRLLYQPRVELHDLHLRGAEALMRWQHPSMGLITPEDFIPIAEESGLIEEMGRWALFEACRQAAEWRHQFGRAFTVSVNVSARQLRMPSVLVGHVRSALIEHRLPPSSLELELTESVILHAGPDVLAALDGLRTLGVSIALDDFGTGYSSLGHLRKLPVDCLKIDRSFVSDLPTDASALDVLDAILAVARALRLRTVAEGVETAEQFRVLGEHGCLEGQGYLFSYPLSVADFQALLRNPKAISLLPALAASA